MVYGSSAAHAHPFRHLHVRSNAVVEEGGVCRAVEEKLNVTRFDACILHG